MFQLKHCERTSYSYLFSVHKIKYNKHRWLGLASWQIDTVLLLLYQRLNSNCLKLIKFNWNIKQFRSGHIFFSLLLILSLSLIHIRSGSSFIHYDTTKGQMWMEIWSMIVSSSPNSILYAYEHHLQHFYHKTVCSFDLSVCGALIFCACRKYFMIIHSAIYINGEMEISVATQKLNEIWEKRY